MAKRRPVARAPQSVFGDEALVARLIAFSEWVKARSQLVIGGVVVVVLLAVGAVYYFIQRGNQLDQAAQELESLQQTIGFEDPATAVAAIDGFLARHGDTAYGVEARMVLARVHLIGNDDPAAAIAALEPVAPDYGSSLGTDATFLLAAAFEQAARWDEAAALYEELRDRSEYAFQRNGAIEGLARSRLAQGDTAAAVAAYEALLADLGEDDPARMGYEMRLAELTAGGV
jgi:predicted negative regulator of RcsB-dependent stress response